MRVSGLDKNNDWTFGLGKASYKVRSARVVQNMLTRIKSFKFDWFLDTTAHIDWLTILGNRDNQDIILRELARVILSTDGIVIIDRLEVRRIDTETRKAFIDIEVTDVYSETYAELIEVP